MKYNRKTNGFSLTELLITIFILTVIISLSVPFFGDMQARIESKRVITTIQTALVQSRHHAFTHKQRIAICSSEDGSTCAENQWNKGFIIFVDKISNRLRDTDEKILYSVQLDLKYGTLKWDGVGINNNILFQSDTGLPRGSNGSFSYCAQHPDNSRKIVFSYMGHQRVETLTCE